jgi:hypothetical protein
MQDCIELTAGNQDADSAVLIDWYAEDDVVRVTPRNQQRFEVQKDHAIHVLQLASHAESQIKFLMSVLAEWVEQHLGNVEKACLTIRDDRFAFLVISHQVECDDDLEDAVSDLDFDIANDPNLDLIRLNAMVLPPASDDARNSFLDNRFMLVYRGGKRD